MDFSKTQVLLFLLIRHALTWIGGALSLGEIAGDQVLGESVNELATIVVGAVLTGVGLFWSYANKKGWFKLVTEAAASSPTSNLKTLDAEVPK